MKITQRKLSLIVGLFLFVVGFILLVVQNHAGLDKYKTIVQKKVLTGLNHVQNEHEAIIRLIEQNVNNQFTSYQYPSNYPYFIFKNDSLVYWSDNKLMPNYRFLKNRKSEELVQVNNHQFLLINTPYKQYHIVSNVPLFTPNNDSNVDSTVGYNYSLLSYLPQKIFKNPVPNSIGIKGTQNQVLFYISPSENSHSYGLVANWLTLVLCTLGIIGISIFTIQQIKIWIKKNNYHKASVNLFLFTIFLRVWLLILGLPWQLIRSKYLSPNIIDYITFGDRIITALFTAIVLTLLAIWQIKAIPTFSLSRINKTYKGIISVFLIFFSVLIGYISYFLLRNAHESNFNNIYISLRFYLTQFNIFSYLYIFSIFGIYFLSTHINALLYVKLNPGLKQGYFHWFIGSVLALILVYLFQIPYIVLLSVIFFLLVSFRFKLPKYFYIFKFNTFIYFLSGALSFTFILYKVISSQEEQTKWEEKIRFAESLLQQKDLQAENLLNQFRIEVKRSDSVQLKLQNSLLAEQSSKYFILENLLNPYFSNYHVQLFIQKSDPIGSDTSIVLLKQKFALEKYATSTPDLYYINNIKPNNFYIQFIDIPLMQADTAHLALKIEYKQSELQNRVRQLYDKNLKFEYNLQQYSYAYFDSNNQMVYKKGDFNYLKFFDLDFLAKEKLPLDQDGYRHYIQKDSIGNTVVISSPTNQYIDTISSFSFIFLINLLGILFVLFLAWSVSGFKVFRLSFSSKIQLYLYLAFLVPLTLVIILTLTVVINTFKGTQKRTLLEGAYNLSRTINLHYHNYELGRSSKAYLNEQLNELSKNANINIDIYTRDGVLRYTSYPEVYQIKQIGTYINPTVYSHLIKNNFYGEIFDENIENLQFKKAYIPALRLNGRQYGIIGISYTDADYLLEKQIKEVVSIILIIFIVMFILLLVLSYTASSNLTSPLSLIAAKLRRTSLNAPNEKIQWRSNDEIGLLTSEYNQMIQKLEESKEALSRSEKQSAWREMARQVAHEIKNPLTPMKLSIQQLQRTLKEENLQNPQKIERVLASINDQIDNITEIANSFSEFAKMPVPRNEQFDLVSTVRKTVDLYSENNNIDIQFIAERTEIWVTGDRMILNRAVTNLILNGIQSVPKDRTPNIQVRIFERGDNGIVEVRDNGSGIDEKIRSKIYIPNFSTKIGGSGLGLSMAKRGVEHVGGNIWYETVEGEGTTFYVDLPKVKTALL